MCRGTYVSGSEVKSLFIFLQVEEKLGQKARLESN